MAWTRSLARCARRMCSSPGLIRAAVRPDATLLVEMLATGSGDGVCLRPEGVQRSGRIAAWTTPDEFDHLLQLARCEFGHDVVDARLWSRRTAAMTVSGTPSAAAHLTDARSLAGTYPTSGLRAAGAR